MTSCRLLLGLVPRVAEHFLTERALAVPPRLRSRQIERSAITTRFLINLLSSHFNDMLNSRTIVNNLQESSSTLALPTRFHSLTMQTHTPAKTLQTFLLKHPACPPLHQKLLFFMNPL